MPPHFEAEESLLGALMLSPNVVEAVAEIGLRLEHFSQPAHRHIYAAVRSLMDRGEPIDVVTVAIKLRSNGLLDEIGGIERLFALHNAVSAGSKAVDYAKIMADDTVPHRLAERRLMRVRDNPVSDPDAKWASAAAETSNGLAQIEAPPDPKRERLPRKVAEARYLDTGLDLLLESVRDRAQQLDRALVADGPDGSAPDIPGPVADVTAHAVADQLGKTRGAITNIWGSQQQFHLALLKKLLTSTDNLGAIPDRHETEELVDSIDDVASAVSVFADGELERGPRPDPDLDNLTNSQLWGSLFLTELAYYPYAQWSARVRKLIHDGNENYLDQLVNNFYQPGLDGLGRREHPNLRYHDLARILYALTMGFWLMGVYAPEKTDQTIDLDGRKWTLFAHAVDALVHAFTLEGHEPGPKTPDQ